MDGLVVVKKQLQELSHNSSKSFQRNRSSNKNGFFDIIEYRAKVMKSGINLLCFFPVLSLFCSACVSEGSTEKIDMIKNSTSSFSINVVKTIKLESCNDSCLIGKVFRLEYYKNLYYVFDKRYAKSLFVFDDAGSFKYKTINGHGPGEIGELEAFHLDTIDNIPKLRLFHNKITEFTYDGKYLREYPLPPLVFYDICKYNEKGWMIFSQYPLRKDIANLNHADFWTYYFVDNEYNVIECFFPFPAFADQNAIGLLKGMTAFNQYEIKCLLPLDNKIYTFNGKDMKPRYEIDFGRLNIDQDDIQGGLDLIDASILEGTMAGRFDGLIETDDFIIFSYFFGKNPINNRRKKHYGVYSKKAKKTAVFSDIIKNTGLPDLAPMACRGSRLICVIDIEQLEDITPKQMELLKIQGAINNPILVEIEVDIDYLRKE